MSGKGGAHRKDAKSGGRRPDAKDGRREEGCVGVWGCGGGHGNDGYGRRPASAKRRLGHERWRRAATAQARRFGGRQRLSATEGSEEQEDGTDLPMDSRWKEIGFAFSKQHERLRPGQPPRRQVGWMTPGRQGRKSKRVGVVRNGIVFPQISFGGRQELGLFFQNGSHGQRLAGATESSEEREDGTNAPMNSGRARCPTMRSLREFLRGFLSGA
jgi:hypothetical protein